MWIETGQRYIRLEHVAAIEKNDDDSVRVMLIGGHTLILQADEGLKLWNEIKVHRDAPRYTAQLGPTYADHICSDDVCKPMIYG